MPESSLPRVSTVRHWKQVYHKGGPFIWRRRTVFAGVEFLAGEDVPVGLLSLTKERRFWRASRIELKGFLAPDVATGAPMPIAAAAPPAQQRRRRSRPAGGSAGAVV